MAQLVERSLKTSEVTGLNTAISKFYIEHLFTVNHVEKMKIKKRETENGLFKNIELQQGSSC